MARQAKTGLEYFSHDVDCLQDKKLRIIKAKYGLIGYGVFFTILEHLYRDNFFLLCDNDFIDIFIGENRDVNESLLTDLIKDFLKYGLFDKNLYIDYKVLTSERIQRNYFEAIKRRKTIKITDRLILIEHAEIPKNVIIVSSKGEESKQHVNIMDTKGDTEKDSCKHSANKSTQSKVKESKVKESKVKESKPVYYREFKHLSISAFEVKKIIKLGYRKGEVDNIMDDIENFAGNKKYVSLYLTALNWLRMRDSKQGVTRQKEAEVEIEIESVTAEIEEDNLEGV